jgi:hypothetical protein
VISSSMAWVEKKAREGGSSWSVRGEEGEGRALGEVEGSVGPDGGAWRGFSARTTRSQRHARTVRDQGTYCPPVVDKNFSPMIKFQTCSSKPLKIPQKFVLIKEIITNPFCLN